MPSYAACLRSRRKLTGSHAGSNPVGGSMNDNIENSEEFNKAFWEWFDQQPKPFRDRFLYYKEDASKIYFYNQVYMKGKTDNGYNDS